MERRAVRIGPPALDLVLGIVVAALQVQGTLVKPQDIGARPLTDVGYLGYVLLIASGLMLALRRRWPTATFGTVGVISVTYYAVGYTDGPGWIALFISLYTLTAHGDGRRSLQIAGVGIAGMSVGWLVSAIGIEPRAAIGWVFFRIAASVMAAALGESFRSRKAVAAEALERARQAERSREEEARSRVDAERLRIAREVHDTVAHAIAIINVQSGVTAYQLDTRPDRAREALVTIEQTSAQALHEMRAVLGVLRDPDDGRTPHPGLGQLDTLTAMAREAGLDVVLDAPPAPALLPSAVDHTAYRILQESITNVIRHVGPTRVTIALSYDADVLLIRVADDGRRAGPGDGSATETVHSASSQPGRGITGMRERCELLFGELTAGPRPRGGFEVHARLPLEPVESVHP